MSYFVEESSLSHSCILMADAKPCTLECNIKAMCVPMYNMPLFLLGFLAQMMAVHILKTMKSISYAYKCTHGVQGVDCEFMMVVGVGRGNTIL